MPRSLQCSLQCVVLLAALTCAAGLHAQATPLPPGTSLPDASSAQQASPDHAATLIAQAEDNIVHSEYDKALLSLNSVIDTTAATAQEKSRALYDRGYVEQVQHQPAAAETDFRKAIADDPKQFESHVMLGRLFALQEQWKNARQELELAATLEPASGDRMQAKADVYRTLAHIDTRLHDDAAVSDALLAALKLTPEQNDDTLLAAQLAEDENNYAGAEQEYKKALAADPKSVPIAEHLAHVFNHEGKYSDAEPVLQQALQQESNDPVLLAESATALAGEGKTQDAVAQLEALHQQNPNQPAVTRMLADLYSSGGQAAKAEPLYLQLISADPRNTGLLTAAAENLMHEQKWSQAVQVFQQSLHLQPQQADAWSGLAFAASQNQQYALVLIALDHRAQYITDSPATLFLRATALDHLHHSSEAIPYYQKFLSESQGKFPDEESQTRRRLMELKNSH